MKKIMTLTAIFCFTCLQLCSGHPANKEEFGKAYEEVRMTVLAAQTCAGSYVPEGKANEYRYLKRYGFNITPYAQEVDGVKVNFMVATNPKPYDGRRLAVLAVRGSADKNDWHINLKTKQVPFATQEVPSIGVTGQMLPKNHEENKIPMIHQGFNAYTQAALKCKVDIDGDGKVDDIAAKLKSEPDLLLLITGHSLGGAVATLYGEYLVRSGVPREQIPVITFGAPAVGNAAFAAAYGDKIDLTRLVTSYDPVPGSLQSFFGGYKQFGKLKKYKLPSTYTDFQHPIAFYFDLALKDYYITVDQGVEAGWLPQIPLAQLKGEAPLVALALTAKKEGDYERYMPDIRRFVLEEYLMMLPRYIVIENNIDNEKDTMSFNDLMDKAHKNGAQYLLVIDADIRNIKQTDKLYVSINQGIFTVPDSRLITMDSGNTRITFQQGTTQATIALVENSRDAMKKYLPFARQSVIPRWKELF